MRRTERLFKIIQILRRSRRPITGNELAEELETSLRTLYRDMAELTAQRVPIRGEAGTGYVIDSDFDMPPLMLTHDELEAAVLGAAWVAERGDPALARGAQDLVAKLSAAVPEHLRPVLLDASLRPFRTRDRETDSFDVGLVRAAIRDRQKLKIAYRDAENSASSRTIWPFMIAYMDHIRMICAWCELRDDFRHFRTDRVVAIEPLDAKFRPSIRTLRQRWKVGMEASRGEDCSPSEEEADGAAK